MSTEDKSRYVIGKRPPVTLTAKAREQLEATKPSLEVAALAKVFAKLFATSSNGEKFADIPGIERLKPGDVTTALTAKDAARASRKALAKNSSRKNMAKEK